MLRSHPFARAHRGGRKFSCVHEANSFGGSHAARRKSFRGGNPFAAPSSCRGTQAAHRSPSSSGPHPSASSEAPQEAHLSRSGARPQAWSHFQKNLHSVTSSDTPSRRKDRAQKKGGRTSSQGCPGRRPRMSSASQESPRRSQAGRDRSSQKCSFTSTSRRWRRLGLR